MKLVHLSATGSQVPTVTLEFAPHVTVIYGASETGKSYIGEAIDFLLGAKKLRRIPQAEGYQQLLLCIDFDGEILTLSRKLTGGRISVYEGDLKELPEQPAIKSLSPVHNKDNDETISHFLLDHLNLAGSLVRKNKRNETVRLSFRNLAHLIIVNEERMYSEESPVETGLPQSRTTERSVLKLLLEGEDDSDLQAGQDPAAFRRLNRAQLSVLERALNQLQVQLEDAPDRQECATSLKRVNESIKTSSEAMSEILQERDTLLASLNGVLEQHHEASRTLVESQTLQARFSRLQSQYETDLQRLDTVRSTGNLLGFFHTDVCIFCGAKPEDQEANHADYEWAELSNSIQAEETRTRTLQNDLAVTLEELRRSADETTELLSHLSAEIAHLEQDISILEQNLQPFQNEFNGLLERRSKLEKWITHWEQTEQLQTLIAAVASETPATSEPITSEVSRHVLESFTNKLKTILGEWEVPSAHTASFSMDNPTDVILEGRPRSSRGKGIRSILHAGFATCLGEYCLENDLSHPGFMVLDTPVLTYRDADTNDEDSKISDEHLSPTVAESFYRYLSQSPIQSIILENQTPPMNLGDDSKIIYFSGSQEHGRSGFYPPKK